LAENMSFFSSDRYRKEHFIFMINVNQIIQNLIFSRY